MPALTEASDIEQRIMALLGYDPQPADSDYLSRAKKAIMQAGQAGTWSELEKQAEAEVGPFVPQQVPDLYEPPKRGFFEFGGKRDDNRKYWKSVAERDEIGARNNVNGEAYQQRLNAAVQAKEGTDKDSLYQQAINLLYRITSQKPFDFGGSQLAPQPGAFTSQDIDEASFLRHYIGFRQQIGKKDFRAAARTLDGMLSDIVNAPLHVKLQLLKDDVILEQARALIDADQYDLAIESANRVDNIVSNGEASYLRGEAYLRLGNFNQAAVQFRNSYAVNPNRLDIDGKIIAVFKGQISQGNVDQAVADLDAIVEASKTTAVPFTEQRKYSLLLEQARALMEAGPQHYDLAYKITTEVNDQVMQGQASYLRGEISLGRGAVSQRREDYEEADKQFRTAFAANPYMSGLLEKLAQANAELAQRTPEVPTDYSKIKPEVAEAYKKAAATYNLGRISDRPDGSGAKTLFSKVLEMTGYIKPGETELVPVTDIGPRIQSLNDDERLLLAKTLHYMANISRYEVSHTTDPNERKKLLHDAIGFDPTNPSNVGYIGRSLAVVPTQNAYVLLAETIRETPRLR